MNHSFLPFNAKFVGAAALFALSLSSAHAASLGKLTVLSSLGQPLHAEIELTSVAKGEASSLVAKLAPMAAFRKIDIDYNPALSLLHFEVEKRRKRRVIKITSTRPINEPFISMLLELRSDRSRLVREYTFLLDPPELRVGAAVQVVSPVAVPSQNADKQVTYAPATTAKSVRIVPSVKLAPKEKRSSVRKKRHVKTRHRVRRGETLHTIAKRARLKSVSLDQALVAIYHANPRAFLKSNMNLLQVGKTLRIPGAATARRINRTEARRIVVAQAGDFANYRQRLAGRAAQMAPIKKGKTSQVAGGSITSKVQEGQTSTTKFRDKLKVSRAATKGIGNSSVNGVGATGERDVLDPSLVDADARIRELEKSIGELRALLQVKNHALAAQQKQAEARAGNQQKEAKALVTIAAPVAKSAEPVLEEKKKDIPLATVSDKAAAMSAAPLAVEKPTLKPKPQLKLKPKETSRLPGFLQEIMGNKLMLALAGLLVLLLALMGVRNSRRKKAAKALEISDFGQNDDGPSSIEPSNDVAGGASNNFFRASTTAPSPSLLDADEVDPLAEAEVYIAYGREQQAIDVLKNALRHHQERHDYRIKLLEIYAERGDVYSFNTLANEHHVLTQGEGDEWTKVASLGAEIAPNNPLYAQDDVESERADAEPVAAFSEQQEETVPEWLNDKEQGAAEDGETVQTEQGEPEQEDLVSSEVGESLLMRADEPEESVFTESAEGDQETEQPEMAAPEGPLAAEEVGVVSVLAESVEAFELSKEAPLEFDLSSTETISSEQKLEEEVGQLEVEQKADELPPLEFDLSSTETISSEQKLEEEVGQLEVEQKADELPPLEFDLGNFAPQVAPEADVVDAEKAGEEPSSATLEQLTEFRLEESTDSPELPQVATPAPQGFDFSSISLDFDTPPPFQEAVFARTGNLEMDTKLDLADAYLGIGDKEGARELLEEVLQGGSEEHIARAKETLAKLS